MGNSQTFFEATVLKFNGLGITDDAEHAHVVPGTDFVRSGYSDAWPLHVTAEDELTMRLMTRHNPTRVVRSDIEREMLQLARGTTVTVQPSEIAVNSR